MAWSTPFGISDCQPEAFLKVHELECESGYRLTITLPESISIPTCSRRDKMSGTASQSAQNGRAAQH